LPLKDGIAYKTVHLGFAVNCSKKVNPLLAATMQKCDISHIITFRTARADRNIEKKFAFNQSHIQLHMPLSVSNTPL
jgi:hypothetical protein